jgi:hypothetical protein
MSDRACVPHPAEHFKVFTNRHLLDKSAEVAKQFYVHPSPACRACVLTSHVQ